MREGTKGPNTFRRAGAALLAVATMLGVAGCSSGFDSADTVQVVVGNHGELEDIPKCDTDKETLLAIPPDNIPPMVDKLGPYRLCHLNSPGDYDLQPPAFVPIAEMLRFPEEIEESVSYTCSDDLVRYLLNQGGVSDDFC